MSVRSRAPTEADQIEHVAIALCWHARPVFDALREVTPDHWWHVGISEMERQLHRSRARIAIEAGYKFWEAVDAA